MHITKAPKVDLVPCKSSQLHSFGHCPVTNTLAIRFKSKSAPDGKGSLYHYPDISADVHKAMATAESVGTFFGQHIKPLGNHIKIDETPLDPDAKG
jgi:hypothetical protein